MPKDLAGDTLYTLDEVAEALSIPGSTLRLYARDGRLKARKIGKAWHVTEAALRAFLQQSGINAQTEFPPISPASGNNVVPALSESELQMASSHGHLQTAWPAVGIPISKPMRQLGKIDEVNVGVSLIDGTVFLHLSSSSAERLNAAITTGIANLSLPDGRSLAHVSLSANGTLTSKERWEYVLPLTSLDKIPRGARVSLAVLGRIVGSLPEIVAGD